LRQNQRGQQIALLAPAYFVDFEDQRGPFDPVILAVIFRVAITIVFEVQLIVLVAVADEIVQRKAVVARHKIDARGGPPPRMFEYVARAMHASCKFRHHAVIAAPEAAHGIAITVVPFAPARWKVAQLIAARTNVPGLRYKLYGRKRWILMQCVEKPAASIEAVVFTPQHRCKVEAEAIDTHLRYPVTQAVHHHHQYIG